jgi:hypothetical protein
LERLNCLVKSHDELSAALSELKSEFSQIKEWSRKIEHFLEKLQQAIKWWSNVWDKLGKEASVLE